MGPLVSDERAEGQPGGRLRVLMVAHEWFEDHPGGAGRYMGDAARGLAARGHRITVIVPRRSPELPARATVAGVDVHRLGLGHGAARWIAGLSRQLGPFVAAYGPFDVVHSHFAPAGLAALWHPALAGARRVTQFQGPWAGEGAAEGAGKLSTAGKWALEKAAYSRCDAFITLSKSFAELLASDYGIAPSRIHVVPAAVDLARFKLAPDRAALRETLGMGPGPEVFTMRRLVQRMGLEVLIDAFGLLRPRLPAARLKIAGAGPFREALEARIQAAGLAGAVELLGRVSDELAIAHYQAADLVVIPTLSLEGFGLITVESLACGTPVVGTTAGATPEILGPLDDRLLVPPGDAPALAERLYALLSDPSARPSRDACRTYAQEHYSWPRVLDRLEAVLSAPPLTPQEP